MSWLTKKSSVNQKLSKNLVFWITLHRFNTYQLIWIILLLKMHYVANLASFLIGDIKVFFKKRKFCFVQYYYWNLILRQTCISWVKHVWAQYGAFLQCRSVLSNRSFAKFTHAVNFFSCYWNWKKLLKQI